MGRRMRGSFSEDGERQRLVYTIEFDIPGYNHRDYVSATEIDALVVERAREFAATAGGTDWQPNLAIRRKGFRGPIA